MVGDKIKILTVLKKEHDWLKHSNKHTIYTPDHVYKIRDMCKKHIKLNYEFLCLTDFPNLDCNTIPLQYNLNGWWSKFELFKIKGPVFYLDLDTIIINNIDSIIKQFINYNFSCFCRKPSKDLWTTVMGWNADVSSIYNYFKKINLIDILSNNNSNKILRGDQDLLFYITKHINLDINYIKSSSKKNGIVTYRSLFGKHSTGVPSYKWQNNKIIIFTGIPRPWEQNNILY